MENNQKPNPWQIYGLINSALSDYTKPAVPNDKIKLYMINIEYICTLLKIAEPSLQLISNMLPQFREGCQ